MFRQMSSHTHGGAGYRAEQAVRPDDRHTLLAAQNRHCRPQHVGSTENLAVRPYLHEEKRLRADRDGEAFYPPGGHGHRLGYPSRSFKENFHPCGADYIGFTLYRIGGGV